METGDTYVGHGGEAGTMLVESPVHVRRQAMGYPVGYAATEDEAQLADASTDLAVGLGRTVPTVVRRPRVDLSHAGRFVVHEFWEGVVEEIYDTYFVAQLVSSSAPRSPECAEIYCSEVSPSDLPLLRSGAVFYWAIGYADSPSGQRTRSSMIRFRRLPSLSRTPDDPWIGAVRRVWLKSS